MTHLFLIRHAQAHSNVKSVAAGPKGDAGLTDLGIAQAEKLRERLQRSQEIKPDVIISSDLPRARQTAEIVASIWDLPILLDEEFRELNAGEADGMNLEEIRAKYSFDAFMRDHFAVLAPGAESHAQLSIRAGLALQRITTFYEGKTIVVFTHGSIVDNSFYLFFNVSPLIIPPVGFSTQNTAITHWDRVSVVEGSQGHWRLNRHNDDAHLRNL